MCGMIVYETFTESWFKAKNTSCSIILSHLLDSNSVFGQSLTRYDHRNVYYVNLIIVRRSTLNTKCRQDKFVLFRNMKVVEFGLFDKLGFDFAI